MDANRTSFLAYLSPIKDSGVQSFGSSRGDAHTYVEPPARAGVAAHTLSQPQTASLHAFDGAEEPTTSTSTTRQYGDDAADGVDALEFEDDDDDDDF